MTVKRACAVLGAVTRAKKTYAEVERRTEQRYVGFSKFIASTIKIVIQSLVEREDPGRCKNMACVDCVDTDTLHILQLKYFHKEITSCASLIPTVPSPARAVISDGAEHNKYNIPTTAPLLDTPSGGCWLKGSPPSSLPASPFYNFNLLLISINVYNGPTYQ